jgi:hypothetical protein
MGAEAEGLVVELDQTELPLGEEHELSFRIADASGGAVTEFDLEHERRMHLIVVRRDLTGFQHLHPEMGKEGNWSTSIVLEAPGEYQVFADFSHAGQSLTLVADCTVEGEPGYEELPSEEGETQSDLGHQVALAGASARAGEATELSFQVTRDGEAVEVEPYLGADGHLVALREGDLAFLHVHPLGGAGGHGDHGGHAQHGPAEAECGEGIRFMTEFPSEGRYRLFLQFQHQGRVHTAAFTRVVSDR